MDAAQEFLHELRVLERVDVLTREGLWKRIKVIPQPKDPKCHWNHLLEEMEWMSNQFSKERAYKAKQTKKCANMVRGYFRSQEKEVSRIMKEEESQRRRKANEISKLIKKFWENVEKIVKYKVMSISELARRRCLDEKLNKVLNTSEKIAEEISSSLIAAELETKNDKDFLPTSESEPDIEDTIEQEEKQSKLTEIDYENERMELEEENNLSYEELLAKYSSYLQKTNPTHRSSPSPDIVDFSPCSEKRSVESRTDPKRISNKWSKMNGRREKDEFSKVNAKRSTTQCTIEAETSAYSLRQRKRRVGSSTGTDAETNDQSIKKYSESDDSDNLSLDELITKKSTDPNFQPSGHTFESTKVTTKVPSIIRGDLREYQHIGLDWLVTMYNHDLNGILADEMGLGKTIQTIALLAYLAIEKGNWGPHLIIVPSSLMMNWELEILKWCPSFKILTYYGSTKERKLKREGWSVPNSFHICITSYTLAVRDHVCFRRRPWEYMILDEAQNIKNFKSQRWQVLLNFNTKRRLLLTGTPLQNNLMELWSLLHFLMPHVFESHSEFREWFSKPMWEITSGSREYNENIVKQFHKTLRPFMLRRLKSEVEKQMPKKIEHVIKCGLSKRQRHLYDEFMARSETKTSISCGSFLNVLNVLMQLRKVCNHPDLFEPRAIMSPFRMEGISPAFPKCIWDATDSNPDICELMNIKPYGSRRLQLDVNCAIEFVYEPLLPARKCMDYESQTPVINLFLNTHERPEPPEGSVTVERVKDSESNFILFKMQFDDEENDALYFTTPPFDESNVDMIGEIEIAQSQSSFSLASFSQSQFDSVANSTLDTDAEDLRICEEETGDDLCPFDDITDEYEDEEEYYPICSSEMILQEVEERKYKDKKDSIANLQKLNLRRYDTQFLLDVDVFNCCSFIGKLCTRNIISKRRNRFKMVNCKEMQAAYNCESGEFGTGAGYAVIMLINQIRKVNPNLFHHPIFKMEISKALINLVQTVEEQMSSISLDLIMHIPPVCIEAFPEKNMYNPKTAQIQYRYLKDRDEFKRLLSKPVSILHPIASRLACSFPDPRLVEHDCGKLQVLSGLLRDLKSGNHKVLLFTQMTKMLNILEVFLNYQGHIYLRMDGSTKVEQRQLLVERFNKDPKIFCFLLSTRAGGLGINLTGADTVIFYDSDWNPTIDAQAQDRCHRIGQTRDVHIYRLISENSVEENILKTSNQKRLLGEHAIEDGKFNLEYFKKDSFRQLFDIPEPVSNGSISPSENIDTLSREGLEKVLAAAEDDVDDRRAVLAAMKEVEAVRNEFSEEDSSNKMVTDLEQLRNDFINVFQSFNDVERYALRQFDPAIDDWSDKNVEEIMQSILLDENDLMVDHDDDSFSDSSNGEDLESKSVSIGSVSDSENSDSSDAFEPEFLRAQRKRKTRARYLSDSESE